MAVNELFTVNDIEIAAKLKLKPKILDYIEGGAFYESTIKDNTLEFRKYKIRPRVMRNVSSRDLSTTILGHLVDFPVGIAPTTSQDILHPQGQYLLAEAALKSQTFIANSHFCTQSANDVMTRFPSLLCFQQILLSKPRSICEKLVRMAEQNNMKGVIITMDMAIYPLRYREIKNKMVTWQGGENNFNGSQNAENIVKFTQNEANTVFNGSSTWDDVDWLRSITKLPIIAKGILTAEDATLALDHGIDAIWVSNHGGRALDCVSATIDVLSEIITAVDGRCEVYVDGGFRTGLDVFKALAMGARAVFIGKPAMYGLALAGMEGTKKVLDILKQELDNTMALAGCKDVQSITNDHVMKYCCRL